MSPAERFAAALSARSGDRVDPFWMEQFAAADDRVLFDAPEGRQLQNGWSVCQSLAHRIYDLDPRAPYIDNVPFTRAVWESLRFARVAVRKPNWTPAP